MLNVFVCIYSVCVCLQMLMSPDKMHFYIVSPLLALIIHRKLGCAAVS